MWTAPLHRLGSWTVPKEENELTTTAIGLDAPWLQMECDQLPHTLAAMPPQPWWTVPSNSGPK